jgi:hypothetical protein
MTLDAVAVVPVKMFVSDELDTVAVKVPTDTAEGSNDVTAMPRDA